MNTKHLFISILIVFLGNVASGFSQSKYVTDKNINLLLKKKIEYNKSHKVGFRIQLYNGQEKRAKNIKHGFETEFPDVFTKLDFSYPEWKVQVGSYRTRLDADRALNKFREKFSGAIVIPIN